MAGINTGPFHFNSGSTVTRYVFKKRKDALDSVREILKDGVLYDFLCQSLDEINGKWKSGEAEEKKFQRECGRKIDLICAASMGIR